MVNKNAEAQKIYLDGYEAFEQGDFKTARVLADKCLAFSSQTSYWYAGALGLKCWVANFTNDLAELDQTAGTLLALETGFDKPWFDGLALLNLGLARDKEGHPSEAQTFYMRAAEQYQAVQLQPGQPGEWQHVVEYFRTLCRWGATKDTGLWGNFLDRFRNNTGEQSELFRQLSAAGQLMLRYVGKEEVKQEAKKSIEEGVSRTFLSVVLLMPGLEKG